MKKYPFVALFTVLPLLLFSQSRFDLLPQNMVNYLGKVNRVQFEEAIGNPARTEDDVVVYQVANSYDEILTDIRCRYRESDGKLISVRFGTPHYLGYWINFIHLPGYPKTEAEAKRLGMYLPKEDKSANIYQVNFRLKNFGCQIMDIRETPNRSTAVINYHVLK